MSEELRGLKSEKQLLTQEGNALKLERGLLLSQLVELEAKITLLQEDQEKLWSVNETLFFFFFFICSEFCHTLK